MMMVGPDGRPYDGIYSRVWNAYGAPSYLEWEQCRQSTTQVQDQKTHSTIRAYEHARIVECVFGAYGLFISREDLLCVVRN